MDRSTRRCAVRIRRGDAAPEHPVHDRHIPASRRREHALVAEGSTARPPRERGVRHGRRVDRPRPARGRPARPSAWRTGRRRAWRAPAAARQDRKVRGRAAPARPAGPASDRCPPPPPDHRADAGTGWRAPDPAPTGDRPPRPWRAARRARPAARHPRPNPDRAAAPPPSGTGRGPARASRAGRPGRGRGSHRRPPRPRTRRRRAGPARDRPPGHGRRAGRRARRAPAR